MIYTRRNLRVCFLLPTMAVGYDTDDLPFVEIAWLFFAIGFGSKE